MTVNGVFLFKAVYVIFILLCNLIYLFLSPWIPNNSVYVRIITTDGVPVTLEERIWMNKLIEHNDHARHLVEELCGDSIWDIP